MGAPQLLSVRLGTVLGIIADHEGPQGFPARVTECAPAVAWTGFVQIGTTRRAEPQTRLIAQRYEGQLGDDEITDRLLEVDLLVAERVGLLLDRILLEDLPQGEVEVGLQRAETPAADGAPAPPHPTRRHDGGRQALQAEVDGEGFFGIDRG